MATHCEFTCKVGETTMFCNLADGHFGRHCLVLVQWPDPDEGQYEAVFRSIDWSEVGTVQVSQPGPGTVTIDNREGDRPMIVGEASDLS